MSKRKWDGSCQKGEGSGHVNRGNGMGRDKGEMG